MIRVCHLTSVHSAEDVRIFHKECVSLAGNGYEVFLVAHGSSYDKYGVHIVGVGDASSNRLKRMINDAKCVYRKALELNCDIYHIHDPELIPYGIKLKRKGKKVIFDSHEDVSAQIFEKEWLPKFLRRLVSKAYRIYEISAVRKFDATVVVSPHMLKAFEGVSKNLYVITNYPILTNFLENGQNIEGDLCFAGLISPLWNHHMIIHAMERIENCSYILCGRAENGYLDTLRSLPAWNRVDYKGILTHSDISRVLSSCKVGLAIYSYVPNVGNRIGTMGNTKIFEEMMAGIPIICTNFELWCDFVNRYKCGICVNPESIDEIVEAIIYLLTNPEEAKQMGKNGRRAVEEEFNWSLEEKKLFEMYEKVVEI